jgi:hypothetical protein
MSRGDDIDRKRPLPVDMSVELDRIDARHAGTSR